MTSNNDLVKWALGRRVKAHLGPDGRADPAKCTCGRCMTAQEAADRLQELDQK